MKEKPASIVLEGKELRYGILRTRRNRYVRITVRPERGVLVSIPWRYPEREIPAVLREKSRWIFATLQRIEAEYRVSPTQDYRVGGVVPVLGKQYRIAIERVKGSLARVEIRDGELAVEIPRNRVSENGELTRSLILGWFQFQAKKFFPVRVRMLAATMGVTYGAVRVKDLRSRWGSCSREGNLNFNIRLLAAPPEVVDYIIIHELAHRIQLNHSPRFWAVVVRYSPDYKKHRRWLREHSAMLSVL